MKFLDVVKEVSVYPVRQEANRAFVLGVAGDADRVEEVRKLILADATEDEIAAAVPYLCCASPPYSADVEKRLRYADLLLSLPGGPAETELRPADHCFLDDPQLVIAATLAQKPDFLIAMARRLPGFRRAAAQHVIHGVSRINAEFSAISGISAGIPGVAPLLPAVVGADLLVLTKNQILMVFRLAAIYGDDLGIAARWKEVLPTIGSALGWRALARQLAGLLPLGLGVPARVMIAFAGTYLAGRTTEFVLDEGRRPTREDIRRFAHEASIHARQFAERFRRRRGTVEDPAEILALPPPGQADEGEHGGGAAHGGRGAAPGAGGAPVSAGEVGSPGDVPGQPEGGRRSAAPPSEEPI